MFLECTSWNEAKKSSFSLNVIDNNGYPLPQKGKVLISFIKQDWNGNCKSQIMWCTIQSMGLKEAKCLS